MSDAATGRVLGHRPALDGLRAVAVALVVAFHLGLWRAGWVGVDLFFVLSGYLITGLLVAERETSGGLRLGRFWGRRIRRLMPAVVMTVVLVTVLVRIWPRPVNDGTRAADVAGHLGYFTNWLSIGRAGLGYFEEFQSPSLFRHSWSLAIEEQVYLVWPVIVLWSLRRSGGPKVRHNLARVAALLAVIGAAVQVIRSLTGASIEELYSGTHTRVVAFLLGAWAVCRVDRRVGVTAARRCVAAGLVVVAVASVLLDGQERWTYRGPLLVATLSSLVAVVGAAHLDRHGPAALLSARPLQAVGRWSYGIYLYHWPLAVATRHWPNRWWRLCVVAAVSVGLAAASYRFIEQPIRHGRLLAGAGRRVTVAALGTAAVLAAVVGFATVPTEGARNSTAFRPYVVAPESVLPTVSESSSPPSAGGVVPSIAPAGGERPLRILIVGDSVGQTVAEQLAGARSVVDRRVELVNAALLGCPVFETVAVIRHAGERGTTDFCPRFEDEWAQLIERFDVDAVLMIAGVSEGWAQQYVAGGPFVRIPDPRYVGAHEDGLRRMRGILATTGVPLLIADVPSLEGATGEDEDTRAAVPLVNAMFEQWDRAYADVAVVPFARYFAPLTTEEGRAQRPDGVHPSKDFTLRVAERLLDDVRAAAAEASG